jgi:uncharacterized protein YciI
MPTERAEILLLDYSRSTWLVNRIAEGITNEESVLQLPFRANCFNWVLGHILAGRHNALAALGRPPFWDEAKLSRYRAGSAPITSGENARPLETLLADLDKSRQLLTEALSASTAEDLARPSGTDPEAEPLWQELAGLRWHETYHIGQLGTLRQYIESRRGDEEIKPQFIYLFEAVRPELVTDPDAWTEREIQIAEEHFAYLQRATQAGIVLLAGRSQDGVGPALVILEANSKEDARRFMESDPFVANGLMRARLHPYKAALVRRTT